MREESILSCVGVRARCITHRARFVYLSLSEYVSLTRPPQGVTDPNRPPCIGPLTASTAGGCPLMGHTYFDRFGFDGLNTFRVDGLEHPTRPFYGWSFFRRGVVVSVVLTEWWVGVESLDRKTPTTLKRKLH